MFQTCLLQQAIANDYIDFRVKKMLIWKYKTRLPSKAWHLNIVSTRQMWRCQSVGKIAIMFFFFMFVHLKWFTTSFFF